MTAFCDDVVLAGSGVLTICGAAASGFLRAAGGLFSNEAFTGDVCFFAMGFEAGFLSAAFFTGTDFLAIIFFITGFFTADFLEGLFFANGFVTDLRAAAFLAGFADDFFAIVFLVTGMSEPFTGKKKENKSKILLIECYCITGAA